MKLSLLAPIEKAGVMADAGFDCIDLSVGSCASARIPEKDWRASLARYEKTALPLGAGVGLFPGDMPLVGPDSDDGEIDGFLKTTFARLSRIGIERVVFGSGQARRVPDRFDPAAAFARLLEVSKRMADFAEKEGLTVMLEPLNPKETNVLNTVASGWTLVKKVDHPRFKLLTDYYHFAQNDNDAVSLAAAAPDVVYTHIATAEHRLCPGLEASDYSAWMRALKHGGYDGVVCIECTGEPSAKDLPRAAATLRKAWDEA